MADVFTPEKRSEVMSRIRGGNTRPEIALRSMLHRSGYRFTVTGPQNRKLPGQPDMVLPKYRTVVFVHGCFWHGHEHCPDFRLPQTRGGWWVERPVGRRSGRTRARRPKGSTRRQGYQRHRQLTPLRPQRIQPPAALVK